MDVGSPPTAAFPAPTGAPHAPVPDLGPATQLLPIEPLPTEQLPISPWSGDHDGRPLGRRRWSAAAKASVTVLCLTTVAGAAFGFVEYGRLHDRGAELRTTNGELDTVTSQRDTARQEADAATKHGTDLQSQLDGVRTDLAALTAKYKNVSSVFPITADALTGARLAGGYALANTPAGCSGFSDQNASCVAENFPPNLVITGTAEAGYQVSSSWFGPITLTAKANGWAGSGTLLESVSNTCKGTVNPTGVSIALTGTGVKADEVNGGLVATQLGGTINLDSPVTADCLEASRTASFAATAG